MKICLAGVNASYTHTSLSVRCLKNVLNSSNCCVCEFTINDTYESVIERLYLTRADVYAFSCYIWNIDFILKISSAIKTAVPTCKILFGGPEVSFDAKDVLKKYPFVDFVVCGEGENAFKMFADGDDYEEIPGFVYRKDGDIKENLPQVICDLDSLPRLYTIEELKELKGKIIYYETSRGCPYNCSFCLSSTTKGVRLFSLERVFDDFKMFSECGIELVKLVDRTFNYDEKRTNAIIEFILKNTKTTRFHFEISAHSLKQSTIGLLKNAPKGKFQLEIGVQSTNEKTIKAINRTTDFEKIKENIGKLQENKNIHIHLDLIAGLPYEDKKSFKKSFDDVFSLRPDMLQLGFLKLLKGSKIYEDAKEHNFKFLKFPPYEVISNSYVSYEDILEFKDVERIVEKYYNTGVFLKSLNYCLEEIDSAYDFFLSFAKYFNENGYKSISKSRRELYDIFYEYEAKDDKKLSAFILFDYLKNNKGAPLPYWAKRTDKEFLKKASSFIAENRCVLPCNLKDKKLVDILKHVKIYPFDFDVLGNGEEKPTVVLFDYLNSTQKIINL